MRKVKEWIADHDDQHIPASVKLRIFDKYRGRCAECGPRSPEVAPGRFNYDHIIPLVAGGAHAERNLQLLCLSHHQEKTRADVAEKAKVNRVRKKHLGFTAPRQKIKSRGFAKAAPQRTASRPLGRRS